MKYHQCLVLCWLILCQHHSKSLASASPAAAPHRHSINRHRWLHIIYVLLLQVNSFLSVRYGLSLLTCYAVSSRKKDWILISFETGLCVCVHVCACVCVCAHAHVHTCTYVLSSLKNIMWKLYLHGEKVSWSYLILFDSFVFPSRRYPEFYVLEQKLTEFHGKFQMSCSLLHWIPILRKDMKSLFLTLCASLFWFDSFWFCQIKTWNFQANLRTLFISCLSTKRRGKKRICDAHICFVDIDGL